MLSGVPYACMLRVRRNASSAQTSVVLTAPVVVHMLDDDGEWVKVGVLDDGNDITVTDRSGHAERMIDIVGARLAISHGGITAACTVDIDVAPLDLVESE